MKRILLILLLFPVIALAHGGHEHGDTINNYYYSGGDGEPVPVNINGAIDDQFKISTSMGLAASGVRFRSRDSLQWGAAMSRYEGVGAIGVGLMQQITDKKLELSGKLIFEDKENTAGWVVGISGGF